MTQLLDLCLTLTTPPTDAPAGTIANVELRCDALGLQPLTLQPLHDPFTPDDRKELEWYLETYWQWPYEQFATRGQRVEQLLTDAGKRLYAAVFEQAPAIVTAWRLYPDARRQISIISTVPPALSLPWELLHDEQGFLALRTKNPVSILRRLPQTELAAFATPFTPPLRVLLVTARPDDAGFVDPRGIARELLDEVQPHIAAGTIALEFLRPPTLQTLRERLRQDPPIHILHFDGHGTFDDAPASTDSQRLQGGAQGKLAFEKDDGKCDLVSADDLAQLLQDSGVRLAVLTACQSAKGDNNYLFSSVAARLIRSGVDGVVAMSHSVLVVSAAKYVEAFYRQLTAGDAVPLAHKRARQALHDDPERHTHRRRRDEAGVPIKLKDWWLPHFYQQRPVNFTVARTVSLRPPDQQSPEEQAQSSSPSQTDSSRNNLPPAPLYGFTGRARELHQIERWLLRGKAVVIHGFGGVGKTTVARETADWLMRTGMYEAVGFVSFEHGGDATMLLSALINRLEIAGNYDPRDVDAALALLRPVLAKRRTLVIADNLESILPGGDAPLEADARAQLWSVLLALNEAGAGVVLTSRDDQLGDSRMARGKMVKHLPLRGLHPEDAYQLAKQLGQDLDIAEARLPYPVLRDLLVQLDHHPLAIQLVLTALSDDEQLTLARISADFSALLPRFSDDRQTGRNRSLLASLEYSLRRLSNEERQWLLRLAPFEGGAHEPNLVAITELDESVWQRLRTALERAALIVPEQISNFTAPFLRFHPVLAPYLRMGTHASSVPTADNQSAEQPDSTRKACVPSALLTRYATRYHAVANYLYTEDMRNPLAVRELTRRELPNLRRALELLLNGGALDEAVDLMDSIAYFLSKFGLWRERDELRRRIEEDVAAAGAHTDGALTPVEYMRESGRGEDEFARGNLSTAYARFTALLARHEALPTDASIGSGSYAHCQTLGRLARCLRARGQPGVAEESLRRALAVIDALLAVQPERQDYIRQRGAVLTDLGDALTDQGSYADAREKYEAGLKSKGQLGDTRGQGVTMQQLGTLALRQGNYADARGRYQQALALFQALGEPREQAVSWHQLGRVAQEQPDWTEAERCYRISLEIREQHGYTADAATTCNQLANVAANSGRPTEAEGWYKRALNAPDLPPSHEAGMCNNLADLLKNEVRAGRMPSGRLAEARGYAERALRIRETLDASAGIWATQSILAEFAELEGDPQSAHAFRRRARQSFAAFAGNRWHIDQQFGEFIKTLAAAVRGDDEARAAVAAKLPQLEANGWQISAAAERLYAGERDWLALTDEMIPPVALLVLRVLETL